MNLAFQEDVVCCKLSGRGSLLKLLLEGFSVRLVSKLISMQPLRSSQPRKLTASNPEARVVRWPVVLVPHTLVVE